MCFFLAAYPVRHKPLALLRARQLPRRNNNNEIALVHSILITF